MKCWHCGDEIRPDDLQWLGHDGGDDPETRVEEAYPLHRLCASQPWPMYELTPAEAEAILVKRASLPLATKA